MAEAGLLEPKYIKTSNTVKLILRNNINKRRVHRKGRSDEFKNGPSNKFLNSAISELERTRM